MNNNKKKLVSYAIFLCLISIAITPTISSDSIHIDGTFTPTGFVPNTAPTVDDKTPINGSTNISLTPICEVWANDTDGDTLTVKFYDNSTQDAVLYVASSDANFFAEDGYSVRALNSSTGDIFWSWLIEGLGPTASPAIHHTPTYYNDSLYCVIQDVDAGPGVTTRVYRLNASLDVMSNESRILGNVTVGDFGGYATPIISNGYLYAVVSNDTKGQLLCMNADNLSEVWNYTFPSRVYGQPCISNGILLVPCDDWNLYAFGDTDEYNASVISGIHTNWDTYGKTQLRQSSTTCDYAPINNTVIWTANVTGAFDEYGGATAHDGIVYIANKKHVSGGVWSGWNTTFALYLNNGTEYWRQENRTGDVDMAPSYYDGKVFVLEYSSPNRLFCLDADNGDEIWNTTLIGSAGQFGQSVGIWEEMNYVYAFNDGNAWCLDIDNGGIRWNVTVGGGATSATYYDGKVYFITTTTDLVVCLNAMNGTEIWNAPEIDGWDSTVCVVPFAKNWELRQTNTSVSANSTVTWNNYENADQYNTTYWWKVVVNDSESTVEEIYHFTTIDKPYFNDPPTIINSAPTNQSINISVSPTASVVVYDRNGNDTTVNFYTSPDNDVWTWQQTNSSHPADTVASYVYTDATDYQTTYYWKATADDIHANTTSGIYHFETTPYRTLFFNDTFPNENWISSSNNMTYEVGWENFTYVAYVGNTSVWSDVVASNWCNPNPTDDYMGMTSVQVADLDRTTVNSDVFEDETDYGTNFIKDSAYTMYINLSSTASHRQYVKVFIDFNRDNDFTDSGEMVGSDTGVGTVQIDFPLSITCDTNGESTAMMVHSQFSNPFSDPCSVDYGDCEMYTVCVNETDINIKDAWILSDEIFKPDGYSWDTFDAYVNDTTNCSFALVDPNDHDHNITSGLTGNGDDISAVTNTSVCIYGNFSDDSVDMVSWNISWGIADVIWIDITNASWDIGTVEMNNVVWTNETGITFIADIDNCSVNTDLSLQITTNGATWNDASAPGADEYRFNSSIDIWVSENLLSEAGDTTISSDITSGQNETFDLRFDTPTSTSTGVQQTITITATIVKH